MKYKIVNLEQNTPEWHSFRKGKIGASMAGAILGISPFTTPLHLWEEIQFGITEPQNEAMKRGSEMEEEARKWLILHLGIPFIPTVVQRLDHPKIIASLDGYHVASNGNVYICEIKCGGRILHEKALNGSIPDHYFAQMQHQMDAVGVDRMIYLSYYKGDGAIVEVVRDARFCKILLSKELAFLDSLLDFNPPEATDRDWVQITDPEACDRVEKYKQVCQQIEALEEEKEWLKQTILCGIESRRAIIGDTKVQKINRRGGVDYSKIDVLKEIDLDQYRKPTISTWRIG